MNDKPLHLSLLVYLWLVVLVLLLAGCHSGPDRFDTIRRMNYRLDYNLHEIAWSPDGRNLAATGSPRRGGSQVVVIDLETGQAHPVSEVVHDSSHGPEWSPDGQSLIFFVPSDKVVPLDGGPAEMIPPYNIVIVDAASGEMIRNLGFGSYATWTADPNRVIIVGEGKCLEPVQVMEYDLNRNATRVIGSVPGCITEGADVLDASNKGVLLIPGEEELQLLDIATGNKVGSLASPFGLGSSVWSPTGDMIAFTVNRSRPLEGYLSDHIMLASADGSCVSNPLDLELQISSIDWNQDGTELVFATREAGRIYFMSLTSGVGKELLDGFRQKCNVYD